MAEVAFGVATDTQDAQGAPVARGDRWPEGGRHRRRAPALHGRDFADAAMYSALKQDGQRLYDPGAQRARGRRAARKVTVHSLRLMGVTPDHGALLSVCCSKGFYVRTLCHDLGEALGCPAHMRFLLRTRSGPFGLDTALTLEALAEKAARGTLAGCLLPPEAGLGHMPMAEVPADLEKAVRNGGHIPWARFAAQGVDAERPFGLRLAARCWAWHSGGATRSR